MKKLFRLVDCFRSMESPLAFWGEASFPANGTGRNGHTGQKGRLPSKTSILKGRRLLIEELEDRRLLSVTAAEYEAIREAYAGLELPEPVEGTIPADLNIIEIDAANLSVSNLKAAITAAGTTTTDDLIVLRTTDEANTITYTDAADEISIDLDSESYGKLSIVAFGTKPLTIDANQLSRTMNISAGTVNLGNLTITHGKTKECGGGIYTKAGALTLTYCTIDNNYSAQHGGGIFNESASLTMVGCTVNGNISRASGGGVSSSGTLMMTGCIVRGNSSQCGGGISVSAASILIDCAIIGNSAKDYGVFYSYVRYGGGIAHGGNLTLINCTVSGNSASDGGGIRNSSGTLTLNNTIVALSYGSDYGSDIDGSLSADSSHNLIGIDPKFTVSPIFGKNGVLTNADLLDLKLTAESWAIDRGNNTYVTNSVDMAGNTRVIRS